MAIIKGQNLRIIVGSKVVAASTSASLHFATSLEETSTKDSTNDFTEQEAVSKSWDASVDALFVIDSAETGLKPVDLLSLLGTKVDIEFQHTNGDQNREKDSVLYTGQAIVADVAITAPNKSNSTYSMQLQGSGPLSAS